MENEFANRQNMHLALLALLADPVYQPAWKTKKPLLFTTRAAPIDLALSVWQGLRDVELIAKAKLLHGKLTAALVEYGLDAADATLLAKKTDDYEKLVATPAAAISGRKALTRALCPSFREVRELTAKMDRLVIRFRSTEPGARFAAAWKAARLVRDLGGSAPAEAEPKPPTPQSVASVCKSFAKKKLRKRHPQGAAMHDRRSP